ncbi:minor head protein inhibitor of protease [Citrobacter phage Miller]|uniref:Prohead protease inhibitor n=1 Tax=Citrobacter phage Miller TaxID=1527524 RepID=A0A076YIE4_9CAUD|nr:minor head protein inhibitor of protease [Citrobacter phage Miller]AIK68163.1 prohead protease inhibitor [Citrobacter phage Miller]
MKIDYELVEGFRALPTKEQKGALADYAQSTFEVKLNKQKSFDNMLADLEAAVPAEEDKPELLIDSPEPEVLIKVGDITVTSDSMQVEKDTHVDLSADFMQYVKDVAPDVADQITLVTDDVEPPVSDSNESKPDMGWLYGFSPTIVLMGRSARSNGYYTCPWWIYDWIKKNPDWYKDPDQCPHYSARDTLKSLVYYIKRDGQVTVRETRNSSFDTFKF